MLLNKFLIPPLLMRVIIMYTDNWIEMHSQKIDLLIILRPLYGQASKYRPDNFK